MEDLIPNGTVVIWKNTKEELEVVDHIKTNNQFGYGVYLYRFKGKLDTGFGLYKNEFEIK